MSLPLIGDLYSSSFCLGLGVVLLLALVVPALELSEVDHLLLLEELDETTHLVDVGGVGGADEAVEGDAHGLHDLAERGGVLVRERLGGDVALLRGLLNLEAVLVGAGEEEDVAAAAALEAGVHVGDGGGVHVTDVGAVVHVVDGRGDEALLAVAVGDGGGSGGGRDVSVATGSGGARHCESGAARRNGDTRTAGLYGPHAGREEPARGRARAGGLQLRGNHRRVVKIKRDDRLGAGALVGTPRVCASGRCRGRSPLARTRKEEATKTRGSTGDAT